MIANMARLAFSAVEEGRALMNLDRHTFAARAAEFLGDLNIIHPFREGNGRSQRLLLAAMADVAGHPIAFEIVTRERMIATSIAAGNGDRGGFTRMIEDATDPRRVEAMQTAIGFPRKTIAGWNDSYVATTTAGQSYTGIVAASNATDFLMRVSATPTDWIAIGDVRDLPRGTKPGQAATFTAAHFSAGTTDPAPGEGADPAPRRSGPAPGP